MLGNQKNVIYLQGLTLFSLLMYFYRVGDSLFVTPHKMVFGRILSPEAGSNVRY